jgi:hypothetical protein
MTILKNIGLNAAEMFPLRAGNIPEIIGTRA